MTTDFTSLDLREELVQAITGLGYSEPTPIQSAIIPVMLKGSDVIGQAQTGTGKTAAFALPILHNFTTCCAIIIQRKTPSSNDKSKCIYHLISR